MDRKREYFAMVREWDTVRANFLNYHRSVLESILGQIDQRIAISQEFMQVLIRYFTVKGR